MNIHHLRRFVNPVILERGREYAENGCVHEIEEVEPGVFQAQVSGSENYEVEIELGDDGEVLSSDCDCPYDAGPVCKHRVAVLIELLEEKFGSGLENEEEAKPSSTRGKKKATTVPAKLETPLKAASKETQVELLLDMAGDSKIEERRIRLYLSEGEGEQGIGECRAMIRSSVKQYSDKHGFVEWRNTGKAVKGAEKVADLALKSAEGGKPLQAVAFLLCVAEEMVELLQAADDSDGVIGAVIGNSIELIGQIAGDSASLMPEQRERLLKLLTEAAEQPFLQGWSDWQLGLLEAAGLLAVTKEQRDIWEMTAAKLCKAEADGASNRSYITEKITAMRYERLLALGEEEEAAMFMRDSLRYPDIRKKAIQLAMNKGSFDQAIAMAEEGEVLDTANRLPGLVHQWKKFRYEAYRLSGQKERQRELGLELLIGGDIVYYDQIKALYAPAEWEPVYAGLLAELENETSWWQPVYPRILIQEKETSKLLEYVTKRPGELEQYYSYLVKEYRDEVVSLFRSMIEGNAKQASNRKEYKNVCRMIRLVRKIGGADSARAIVEELLAQYPNRPAFRDELGKV
ncbi:SWIM zinc finger family protein [Paenibacillus ginsengarvi]|uniref:SWIM zinc finger family protein n=1 Tax=Paenibacillus ginsengarvi TaxID=400777 RepID=UPI0013152484|nr:SWIM zinc finger family protein [Paenibacillus ginsengarvi]